MVIFSFLLFTSRSVEEREMFLALLKVCSYHNITQRLGPLGVFIL